MEKSRRQTAREKAMISIYQHMLVDNSLEQIDEYISSDKTIAKNEETYAFCRSLIELTLLNFEQYKNEISKHLKKGWNFERLSFVERAILLIATCELLDTDLEKTIIINEAVVLSKTYCDEESYKFINGVLHSLI